MVSVGAEVWGVNNANEIYRWKGGSSTGNAWEKILGSLKMVSVGAEVWGVNNANEIYRWKGGSTTGNAWERIDGALKYISACPTGVCGINSQGAVWFWQGGSSIGNAWIPVTSKYLYISNTVGPTPNFMGVSIAEANPPVNKGYPNIWAVDTERNIWALDGALN
jgi:hypothetical protein